MNKSRIIIALLLAAVCAGAVSCDGNDKKTSRRATSVTVQEQVTATKSSTEKNDYVPITVEGLDVLYSGWIKMPAGKEYLIILNSPDEKYLNGYTYPDFAVDVYKEEGEWLLVKTNDNVGYIPKSYFTSEAPASEAHMN